MDHNPYLKPWKRPEPNQRAGMGRLEIPENVENIVWQTRPATPTEYEIQLGDALESIFGDGHEELADVVAQLNERGIQSPHGGDWTEESFQAEMKRLGG
ncbi:MAG: recombinase-like helix-turn-helix domain-containing protein [Rhodospirillaceae bacterium]